LTLTTSQAPPVSHSVALSWVASTSSNIAGYNVYRGTTSGGPYSTKANSSAVAGLTYTDTTVLAGQTYYYVLTAVDTSGNESGYSTQAAATIPTP
jgi:fibronectin type 3 domain-containing protein